MGCNCGGGGDHEEMAVESSLELTVTTVDRVELAARIVRLETAIKALALQEFGDSPGHPFRGNQYRDGLAGEDTTKTGETVAYRKANGDTGFKSRPGYNHADYVARPGKDLNAPLTPEERRSSGFWGQAHSDEIKREDAKAAEEVKKSELSKILNAVKQGVVNIVEGQPYTTPLQLGAEEISSS